MSWGPSQARRGDRRIPLQVDESHIQVEQLGSHARGTRDRGDARMGLSRVLKAFGDTVHHVQDHPVAQQLQPKGAILGPFCCVNLTPNHSR